MASPTADSEIQCNTYKQFSTLPILDNLTHQSEVNNDVIEQPEQDQPISSGDALQAGKHDRQHQTGNEVEGCDAQGKHGPLAQHSHLALYVTFLFHKINEREVWLVTRSRSAELLYRYCYLHLICLATRDVEFVRYLSCALKIDMHGVSDTYCAHLCTETESYSHARAVHLQT